MYRMQRAAAFAALVLSSLFSAMTVQATSSSLAGSDLARGIFGLAWGEEPAAVQARYPQTLAAPAPSIHIMSLRGDLQFFGVRVKDGVANAMFDLSGKGLERVLFAIDPSAHTALVARMSQSLGTPRAFTSTNPAGSVHIFEWSDSCCGISVSYFTKGASRDEPAIAAPTITVQRGALAVSQIDQYRDVMRRVPQARPVKPRP